MSNAEFCRAQNWRVGTVFTVEDETGSATFRITAIGRVGVLAEQVGSEEFGFGWSGVIRPFEQVIGFDLSRATLGSLELAGVEVIG